MFRASHADCPPLTRYAMRTRASLLLPCGGTIAHRTGAYTGDRAGTASIIGGTAL